MSEPITTDTPPEYALRARLATLELALRTQQDMRGRIQRLAQAAMKLHDRLLDIESKIEDAKDKAYLLSLEANYLKDQTEGGHDV